MANNCNKFDLIFDSCEDIKTVHFNIDAKNLANLGFDNKNRFGNNSRDSSSCNRKAILIIIIFALLVRSSNSNFNYKLHYCC